MRKYVAIGCDTFHAYSFFLPFTCLFWRRIGYEPILFLVGTFDNEWIHQPSRVVIDALAEIGQEVRWIDHVPGVSSATVAQCVRHHVAALKELSDSDLLMTSDADLFPLRREFFHQHGPFPVALYYSNVYGDNDHWTNLHMSFSVGALREIMGIQVGDVRASMLKMFEDGQLDKLIQAKKDDPSDDRLWFFDERYPSRKIIESRFYPRLVQKIPREGHPPKDQINRGPWLDTYTERDYVDYHAPRPGWADRYWPWFRPLLARFIPDRLAWADFYRTKFWEFGPDRSSA